MLKFVVSIGCLILLLIFYSGCKDESITECKCFDLCDLELYCSFNMDDSNYYFNQYLEFDLTQVPDFRNDPYGSVLINHLSFFDELIMVFSKNYPFVEYSSFPYEADINFTTPMIKYLPYESALEMFNGVILPSKCGFHAIKDQDGRGYIISSLFDSPKYYVKYYDEGFYYPLNGLYLAFRTFNQNDTIALDRIWETFPVQHSKYYKPDDSTSYFEITNLYPYRDMYHIIEGNFKLRVYNYEYYEINYEYGNDTTILIETIKTINDGEFRLAVPIPGDDYDYSRLIR